MARLLFVTGDAGGNFGPALAVIRALVDKGHAVDLLPVPWLPHQIPQTDLLASVVEHTKAAGARPVGVEEWGNATAQRVNQPPLEELLRFDNALTGSFYTPLLASTGFATARMLRERSYDLVAIDMAAPGAAGACDAHGVPYGVLVSTVNLMRWWPGRPCPGTGQPLRDDRTDAETASAMNLLLDAVWLDVLNEARDQLGVAPFAHVTDYEDRAAVVIAMTDAAFDVGSENAPANHRYVGPCLRTTQPVAATAQLVASLPTDRPIVVMSPTTTSLAVGQVPFVRASIEALGALPVQGVVTVGRNLDPMRFEAPDNVVVVGHADHNALLPRASALITHCGHGTVMTGLRHGVPLVGVPDFADQRDIAVRIEHHGVGVALPKPATSDDLRGAVARVLDKPSFHANAARFAARLAPDDGAQRAAAALVAAGCDSG